jgi:hypothetical protein
MPALRAMITCSSIAHVALDLCKATFDNTFVSVVTLQEILEDRAVALVRQAPWLPAPAEQIATECVGLSRRTRQDFKSTVDRCYHLLLALYEPGPASPRPAGAGHATPRHAAPVQTGPDVAATVQ